MTDVSELIEQLPEKVRDRFEMSSDGCWRWTAYLNLEGYGYCYHENKRTPAHRLFYRFLVGPIPDGLVCDHLCYVRNCVNPDHIELVTPEVNVQRGHERRKREGRPAPNLKNHCRRGHEFTPENTFMHWRGRTCRRCQYASQQRYRRKIKAEGRRDKIAELELRVAGLESVLGRVDDFIINELAVDQPTMDFCNANPEAGEILLAVRSALTKEGN